MSELIQGSCRHTSPKQDLSDLLRTFLMILDPAPSLCPCGAGFPDLLDVPWLFL